MNDQAIAYLMGELSSEARIEFEKSMLLDPVLLAEVNELRSVFEGVAEENTMAPPPASKKRFLDAIDEIETEKSEDPPILHANSRAEDYLPWMQRDDLVEPEEYDNLHYMPLAQSEAGFTIVVWMKEGLPSEVHNDALERFLVLEGSCEIAFGGAVYSLKAGDFLSIPLHHPHTVKVTSSITCKLIVQRHAA